MKPHITIITLGVADLQRAINFYQNGLGLPRKDESESIAFFDMTGTILALYPRDALAEDITISPEGTGFQGFTLAHNVASPEEVDLTLAEAVAAGAELVKPGQDAFWGGYSGYFKDPDGFYWEVAYNPFL
ncbi:glyoxalase [Candidatus Poribacteria bacterium]|nr:MAG: glyoxalase [Candidatus Poribacteria bacterium]